MAQSGYTPILIYASGTAAALPSAANLTSSANGAELALNYADGKLYYKNSSGVVTLLASAAAASGTSPGGSTTQVQYNNAGAFAGSANLTFNGTTLTANGNTVITSSGATDALRITQTGSGNALLVEDSANPDATPFVVSATGVVGIGTTTPDNVTGAGIALVSNSGYYPQLVNRNTANDANASYMVFEKNRNGAVVQNGDILGNLIFRGYDGANYLQAAAIWSAISATPGTNDMPGDLIFGTTPDGASGITERMRINNAGKITDQYGNIRAIPPVGTKTGSYTLAAADVGRYVQVGSGGSITIPTNVFSEGDAVSLFNNTTGNVTITCSAPTTYKGGTNTVVTSLTLQTRGVATVFFISATLCVVTGNLA